MGVRPVLAVAECNVAVDNIASGLVALGLRVVRVGRPEKVGCSGTALQTPPRADEFRCTCAGSSTPCNADVRRH